MNGTFGTVAVHFSAESLLRVQHLTDVVERLATSIEASIEQIGHVSETIAAVGRSIASMAGPAAPDPVSTAAPSASPDSGATSTQAAPVSTAQASRRPSVPLVTPAPPPAIILGRPTNVWTPERAAILLRDYPAGVPLNDIVAAVNALPGALITPKSLGIRAAGWGIRRPSRASATPSADSVVKAAFPSPPSSTAEAERQPDAARDPRQVLDVSSLTSAPAGVTPPPASLLRGDSKPVDPAAPPGQPDGRPPGGDDVWSREKCDRLKELWATGRPTSDIGRELGVTGNAVIGKAHRLGLSRPSPILSSPREFTDAETAVFLANPNMAVADLAALFPGRTRASLYHKRRALQEQGILPPLPGSSVRSAVRVSLPALPSLADGPPAVVPVCSGRAPDVAGTILDDAAPPAPWQMAVPSGRTRWVPTCGYIIGEGRTATQCEAPAVTLDENGNRYQSGAGMWCLAHRALVYTKTRPSARPEARV